MPFWRSDYVDTVIAEKQTCHKPCQLQESQSHMLIKLQERKVRQHLVPHSRSVWSHEETTVTEHTFHWCWGSRCAVDPLEEAVQNGELRLMLLSFPGVWVSRETAGLLMKKSEVVPHDCWYRNMAFSRLFTLLGSNPKQGLETNFQRPRRRTWPSRSRPRPRTLHPRPSPRPRT